MTGPGGKADDGTASSAAFSQRELIFRRFYRHWPGVISFFLLLLLYGLALLAEFFAPTTKEFRNLEFVYCPPQQISFNWEHGFHAKAYRLFVDPVTLKRLYISEEDGVIRLGFFVKGEPYRLWGLIACDLHFFGSREQRGESVPFYFLGADKFGRDLLSRILYGSRVSLSVGLISITITFLLGTVIGGISGYIGGRMDEFIQRGIEIINAFPQLPLWLAIAAITPGEWSPLRVYVMITVVLSLLNWTGLARVVRGRMLSLREEDYAVAARLLGAGHRRVIFRHLLPGLTSYIIVILTLSVPAMILGETTLSFLGLGLRPPVVSWGVLLQDCLNLQEVVNYPWLLLPAAFIVMTVLAFNFLGDGLRDAADPFSAR